MGKIIRLIIGTKKVLMSIKTLGRIEKNGLSMDCLHWTSGVLKGNIKSVAFPYTIGWGLVRGNWKTYLGMIKEFQKTYTNVSDVFYKLSG
jgi:hypothetical protein